MVIGYKSKRDPFHRKHSDLPENVHNWVLKIQPMTTCRATPVGSLFNVSLGVSVTVTVVQQVGEMYLEDSICFFAVSSNRANVRSSAKSGLT